MESHQNELHCSSLGHTLRWVDRNWSEFFRLQHNEISIKSTRTVGSRIMKGIWTPIEKLMNLHKWKGVKTVKFEFSKISSGLNGDILKFYALKTEDTFQQVENLSFAVNGFKTAHSRDFETFIKDGFRHLEILNIKHLTLEFYGCRTFTDINLKALGFGLSHFLNKLQRLDLSLDYCNKITDEGLKKFTLSIFKNLTYLQHLFLDLEGCNQITDKGFKALVSHAELYLNRLKYLKLLCGACPMITDEGLKYFASSQNSNIRSLQHLSLTFTWSQSIQDAGLQALITNISNFNQLNKLELVFYGCGGITKESFEMIPGALSKIDNHLKTVTLDFSSCVNINQKARDDLAASLHFIPHLTIK